jgi:hypothetical protein
VDWAGWTPAGLRADPNQFNPFESGVPAFWHSPQADLQEKTMTTEAVVLILAIGEAIGHIADDPTAEKLHNATVDFFVKKPETPCFPQNESPRNIDDAK